MSKSFPVLLLTALFVAGLTSGCATLPPAPDDPDLESALDESAVVVRTVERFHHALSSGDSAAVMDLLAPGVRIVEGGGVETREEYASHHLGADMEFLGRLEVEETRIQVWVEGDVAWAVSTTDLSGRVRDRDVSLRSAELAVLARHPEGWRIVSVHWSSRSLEGR